MATSPVTVRLAARAAVLALCVLAVLATLAGAAFAHPVMVAASAVGGGAPEEPTMGTMGLLQLPASAPARSAGGGRPDVTAEPLGAVDRVTPPAALVGPGIATAAVQLDGARAPLVVPRERLPFRFHVERRVADRFGVDVAVGSLRQWDGIPGSRWATAHAGVLEERVAKAAADGRSVLFSLDSCPQGVGGYAYWQVSQGTAEARYGAAAMYVDEVDVGVCPVVAGKGMLDYVVEHEVGHALGLDHLCDPGQECWRQEMGSTSHACRVMYVGASSCRRMDQAEFDSAVHLYPSLRRVSGPSRVETAARFSFASFGANGAGTVVLARADQAAHGPFAAAALSGALGAGFLLANPDAERCVTGTAAEELARVAARPATVLLVGDWPQACDVVLSSWELRVERLSGATPEALAVAVADRMSSSGRLGGSAFLVSARADGSGSLPDGVAAGAAAGAARGPLLYTGRDGLAPEAADWLRRHPGVRRLYVMGGPATLSDAVVGQARALGVEVVRIAGATRVHTAVALASRAELFTAGKPVVVASAQAWPDAATASALGARLAGPVLVTAPTPDAPVVDWLRARRPAGGFVVGGTAALPYRLQWQLSRLVR